MRTQFLLSVARNVIPLLYSKFALKENGLQNYVDAMNWFNY